MLGDDARPKGSFDVRYEVGDCWRDPGSGQHDAEWLGIYDYYKEVCGLRHELKMLAGLWEIAHAGGWLAPQLDVCWISERPRVLHLDKDGLLHCETGPALAYPDGFRIDAIHGEPVAASRSPTAWP